MDAECDCVTGYEGRLLEKFTDRTRCRFAVSNCRCKRLSTKRATEADEPSLLLSRYVKRDTTIAVVNRFAPSQQPHTTSMHVMEEPLGCTNDTLAHQAASTFSE